MNEQSLKTIETDALLIAYHEYGLADGWPVILSHGFPYGIHAFDEVAGILEQKSLTGVFSRMSIYHWRII